MVSGSVKLFLPLILLGLVARAEASEEFIACSKGARYCFAGPCEPYEVVLLFSKAETVFLYPGTERIVLPSGRLVRDVDIDKSALSAYDNDLERSFSGSDPAFVYEGEMTQGDRGLVVRARRIVREASMYEKILCPDLPY